MHPIPASTTTPPDGAPAQSGREQFITGRTVADARRLVRQADGASIFFRVSTGEHCDLQCIYLGRAAFERAINFRGEDEVMPCRLYVRDTVTTLMIGDSASIRAAETAS